MGKKIDESAGIEDEKLFISIQLHDDIVLKSIASLFGLLIGISAEMLSLPLIFPKSNNAGKSSFICCAEHRTTEIINDKKKNIFFIDVPCDDLNQLDITDNYL